MAQITAALVKELRERTGSGMMECKKALIETDGDIEAAVESMRKAGLAKADKKAGRIAAEGAIVIRTAVDGKAIALVEVNCETDFVARGDDFQTFAGQVAERVLTADPASLEALSELPLAGAATVEQARRELIARLGENINVRRFVRYSSPNHVLNSYLHGRRIGVVVELAGGNAELARDIAMQVAASKPLCVDAAQVPPDLLAKEREIYAAQAETSGKPPGIIARMVEGRVQKYLEEITLLGQPFVKNPDQRVGELLAAAGASVIRFQRFELGEGIDKKATDFVTEVMDQLKDD